VRIGVLTTSFPRHAGDYAGSFVGDRVRRLLADGHTVDVLAAGDGGVAREVEEDGLSVTRIAPHPNPLPSGERGQERITCHPGLVPAGLFYGAGAPEALEGGGVRLWLAAAHFSCALAAEARARAHRFDVIESHWLVPSALAGLAAAPSHRQRAFAHSGDVALLERIPFGHTIARRLARAGIAIQFVSDALQARFAALAGRQVGTVQPVALAGEWPLRAGVDLAGRRRLGLARPTVLAVGRLVPIKGHERLLRACARVQSDGALPAAAPLEVVILGDGPEHSRLGRLADALGVRLRLPGFVSRDEVALWLRAADVFVQPSIRLPNGRTEGAPFATAEARAVGIPVLVESDVSRLAEGLRRRFHVNATGV
jgi:glycosyltransferase involved in cell wall biosynthesis